MSRYDKDGLTEREREVYDYIVMFKTVNGFSPSITEIARALITSRNFVRQCLEKLQDKKFIKYKAGDKRTIVVLRLENDKKQIS